MIPFFYILLMIPFLGLPGAIYAGGAELSPSVASVPSIPVGDQGAVRLPALAGEQSGQTTQSQRNDWGRMLATEFAGILVAESDSLNSDSGPRILSALANQSRRRVRRRVARKVAASAEGWLGQFGQARVLFDGGEAGAHTQWSIDYSQPVYRSVKHTYLLEVGGRFENSHYRADAGLVYRHGWRSGQVFGVNLFVDQSLKSGSRAQQDDSPYGGGGFSNLTLKAAHTRGSIGIEYQALLWGVNANIYMPLSGWKKQDNSSVAWGFATEPMILGQLCRPAKGVDVSFEGPLSYAPLRVKVGYSCWFDDGVDIAGGRAFPSPRSSTVGMVWQPISLLKLSASWIFLPGARYDNRLQAELRIDLAKPFRELFRATGKASTRAQLQAVRHGFVNRDRDMPLTYQVISGCFLEAGPDVIKDLDEIAFTQTATAGNGGKVTYSSSDTEVAKVDPDTGKVTMIGYGTAKITATEAASGQYKEQSDSYMLTVITPLAFYCGCDNACASSMEVTYDPDLISTQVRVHGARSQEVSCRVEEIDPTPSRNGATAICSRSPDDNRLWYVKPNRAGTATITFERDDDRGGQTYSMRYTVKKAKGRDVKFAEYKVYKSFSDDPFINEVIGDKDDFQWTYNDIYFGGEEPTAILNYDTGEVTITGCLEGREAEVNVAIEVTSDRYDVKRKPYYYLYIKRCPPDKPKTQGLGE